MTRSRVAHASREPSGPGLRFDIVAGLTAAAVVLEMVRHAGRVERPGRERMLFNARAAIERYKEMQATAWPAPAA